MLGKEIRAARTRAALTQEELAFKAGIHRTYISLLERNKRSPTVDVLIRICRALGVSASRMISRVEKWTA